VTDSNNLTGFVFAPAFPPLIRLSLVNVTTGSDASTKAPIGVVVCVLLPVDYHRASVVCVDYFSVVIIGSVSSLNSMLSCEV